VLIYPCTATVAKKIHYVLLASPPELQTIGELKQNIGELKQSPRKFFEIPSPSNIDARWLRKIDPMDVNLSKSSHATFFRIRTDCKIQENGCDGTHETARKFSLTTTT